MTYDLFTLGAALLLVGKGATLATRHAVILARHLRLSRYAVGFIVVAVISILPETMIAINAAIEGVPSLGLGTLFGSNIADLTLVIAIIVLFARRGLSVEGKIVKNHLVYPLILLLPVVLGLNGHYSRIDGLALIIAGGVFYYIALRDGTDGTLPIPKRDGRYRSLLMLFFSMAVLLTGAHFAVVAANALASDLGVSVVLIGMFVIGLGTTMPELFFALRSVRKRDDSLALGDILGTVLADATIVVGLLALLKPFHFPHHIVYVTGVFMVVASFVLFRFMRTGYVISKRESVLLFLFWLLFVCAEIMVNGLTPTIGG